MHPLKKQGMNWSFNQSSLGLQTKIRIKKGKDSNFRTVDLGAVDVCREGIISGLRNRLASTGSKRLDCSWGTTTRVWDSEVDLEAGALKQPEITRLRVSSAHLSWGSWGNNRRAKNVPNLKKIQFIRVADAIVGNLGVLLNPNRYCGDWWRTLPEEMTGKDCTVHWYGYDNTLMYHPALVSLVMGLLRQSGLLIRAGACEEIMKDVPRKDTISALSQSDPDLALRNIEKLRKWIEVPTPIGANASHVPVPLGSFSKVINLHKAIFSHGFEETFQASFQTGWSVSRGSYWGPSTAGITGIHTFMGRKGQNLRGKKVAQLAAHARKKQSRA